MCVYTSVLQVNKWVCVYLSAAGKVHVCTCCGEGACVSLLRVDTSVCGYGVATISRLLKIIGVFCKRAL